jgi:hypothetical protein
MDNERKMILKKSDLSNMVDTWKKKEWSKIKDSDANKCKCLL